MTVHAAKGLEFRNVIIVGVEEDLFPSAMSMDSIYQIEEERRLLYVAITRAEVNCVITYATSRYHNGQTKTCVMSRFLRDISPEFLLMGSTNSVPTVTRQRSRWDDDEDDDFGSMRRRWNNDTPHRSVSDKRSASSTQRLTPRGVDRPSASKPQAKSPTPVAPATSGNFSIHTVDELRQGSEILHQRFGHGRVTDIDTSGSDAKIDVLFNDGQTRKLLLKFAKFEILS